MALKYFWPESLFLFERSSALPQPADGFAVRLKDVFAGGSVGHECACPQHNGFVEIAGV